MITDTDLAEDDLPVLVHSEWLPRADPQYPWCAAQRRADMLRAGEAVVYVFYFDLDGPAHRYYLRRNWTYVTYVEQIG